MSKIRVMIVEDSAVVRRLLEHLIGSDPRLEVVASVGSAEEALRLLHRSAPDVISMDIRLPGMNGFEATRRIMTERPTPIVVVSASVDAEDLQISMNALRAGALSVVEKPAGLSHANYQALAERLCTQLAIMSLVKVVRQRPPREEARRAGEGDEARRASEGVKPDAPAGESAASLSRRATPSFRMLAVVASTGGPAALAKLLGALPATFPLPIVVVQHITACFLDGFASWLGTVCPFPAAVAQDREAPQPGRIYLPPVDRHLRVESGRLRHDGGEPVCLQRPSGTVLFRSMAQSLGPAALAVLLTGMGEDGAEGMAEVRAAGGYTIAEDESTAVVYGMPAAAVRRRGVCESLPLPAIAPRLAALAAPLKEPT
jgi:two-component system chemotaxis response regulator CheB